MSHVVGFSEDRCAALRIAVGRDPALEPHLRSSHVRSRRTRIIMTVLN